MTDAHWLDAALREAVDGAMFAALENEYFDVVYKWPAEATAEDMLDRDAAFEDFSPMPSIDKLVPHIEAWRAAHPEAT